MYSHNKYFYHYYRDTYVIQIQTFFPPLVDFHVKPQQPAYLHQYWLCDLQSDARQIPFVDNQSFRNVHLHMWVWVNVSACVYVYVYVYGCVWLVEQISPIKKIKQKQNQNIDLIHQCFHRPSILTITAQVFQPSLPIHLSHKMSNPISNSLKFVWWFVTLKVVHYNPQSSIISQKHLKQLTRKTNLFIDSILPITDIRFALSLVPCTYMYDNMFFLTFSYFTLWSYGWVRKFQRRYTDLRYDTT